MYSLLYITHSLSHLLSRSNNWRSKWAGVSLFRLGVRIWPPRLNSLSTGALDGSGVLYLRKRFLMCGNLCRQSMFLEASVRNMSTSARASVFSEGWESKQKKSSSWLALSVTLLHCSGTLSVDCCTVLTYSYNNARARSFFPSSSHRSRNCGSVTLAIIRSSRSLYPAKRVC